VVDYRHALGTQESQKHIMDFQRAQSWESDESVQLEIVMMSGVAQWHNASEMEVGQVGELCKKLQEIGCDFSAAAISTTWRSVRKIGNLLPRE
jgi:hypothetical protein